MLIITVVILSGLLAALLIWTLLIKRDMRRMARHLDGIIHTDTNAKLTTKTFDRDAADMARKINRMLERNRLDWFEKIRSESDLKRAVTNISHDLRTPLTSALGYLQMLEDSRLDEETKLRYFEIIKGRLNALSSLMNSLFEFAKIIEGNASREIEKVNAGSVLRDTLSGAYSELMEKGFTVDAEIPEAPVIWMCDGAALKRILQNLIKNVCVHGKNYLCVKLTGGGIEITNNADGIEKLNPALIFDRFYTADASRTGKNTGLGLAIVKELAERTGAEVSASVGGEMLTVRVWMKTPRDPSAFLPERSLP